jgi:hypothetical protein
MSNGTSENLLNYVEYDFTTLVNQLADRLHQESDAWKDTYRSATGQMLIELFAYVGNMVLYYLERRAEESYISTAKHKSSVINLVRLLNYIPKRKTSATGILTFSIPSAYGKNIYIPKWTECQTPGGLKYVTTEDVVILAGGTSVDANAIQGEKVDIEVTADGTSYQEDKINDDSVENSNLFIFVDGEEWTVVTTFLASQADSKNYRILTELDETVTILFGDGIKGKIPAAGTTKLFRYVRSDGVDGNVYAAGAITTINSSIFDEDGDEILNVSVTNADTFLGGDAAEDIEEIRYEAPRVFATGDRAVTKADYIAILENYAGVANANAWGEAEEAPPNYDLFNRVKLVVLLQNWALPGATFKAALADYLYDLAQITVKYEFVEATILQVIPVMDVKVNTGYTLSAVQDDIEETIGEQFVLGTTTRLGTAKRLSDLIHAVDDLVGVSYHHMLLEIRKVMSVPYDSFYPYGGILDAIPVLEGSVRVFVGEEQVAVDTGTPDSSGNGAFVNQSSLYTITGVVNYATGYVGLNISPTPAEDVIIRYQQDKDGDIVVDGQQICKLYDVDITAISYDR